MDLFYQLVIGGVLIASTFVIQAIGFDSIIRIAPWIEKQVRRYFKSMWKSVFFIIIISLITSILVIEMWIWALFYLGIGVMPDVESALYFSTSAFTTVGFGDLYLDKEWRMISAIESVNGFLLFGWATAFIWEVVMHIYAKEGKKLKGK